VVDGEDGDGVGAYADEGGVAERRLPAQTPDDAEAEGGRADHGDDHGQPQRRPARDQEGHRHAGDDDADGRAGPSHPRRHVPPPAAGRRLGRLGDSTGTAHLSA
jgi:hypothetical protein